MSVWLHILHRDFGPHARLWQGTSETGSKWPIGRSLLAIILGSLLLWTAIIAGLSLVF